MPHFNKSLDCSFCQGADHSALKPFVPRIAKDLGPLLLVTTEDTLSLVLETLSVVVEVDGSKWLTPELANSLVLAVLEVWTKNNKGRACGVSLPVCF
jgi:importin-9